MTAREFIYEASFCAFIASGLVALVADLFGVWPVLYGAGAAGAVAFLVGRLTILDPNTRTREMEP